MKAYLSCDFDDWSWTCTSTIFAFCITGSNGNDSFIQQLQAVTLPTKQEPVTPIEIPPAIDPEEIVEPQLEPKLKSKPEKESEPEEKELDPPEEEESEEPGDDAPTEAVESKMSIQPILKGLVEIDASLLEASIASLSSSRVESLNLLHLKNNKKRTLILGLIALGILLISGAYLLRGVGYSIPIPFMSGEEGETIVTEKTPIGASGAVMGSGGLLENESGTGSSSISSVGNL